MVYGDNRKSEDVGVSSGGGNSVTSGVSESVLDRLAAHIRVVVRDYEDSKSFVVHELDICRRQARSEYSDAEKQKYSATGVGCIDYQPLTEGKINVAHAMLFDVIYQGGERSWMIEPTPDPELPEDVYAEIANESAKLFQEWVAEGLQIHVDDMYQLGKDMKQEMRLALDKEAKQRADKMQRKMDDQIAEGKFWDAVNEAAKDFCTYPAAFMRAVDRTERVARFVDGKFKEEDRVVLQWERVSPFNVYPSRNNKKLDDDSLFMKVSYSRAELVALGNTKGYDDKKITKALTDYGAAGLVERDSTLQENVESDRYDNIDKQETGDISAGIIDGFEYWGNVPGKMLKDWGMKESLVDTDEYAIHAILIGNYIIFAQLNTNPLQKKLFYSASYEDDPDSVWGGSLPKKIRSAQRGLNSARRSLITNMALMSGPQVIVDKDLIEGSCDPTEIFPLKVWLYGSSNQRSSNNKPVDFFQPNANLNQLLPVMEKFSNEADEFSALPRYSQGSSEGARVGAAGTATGLSMLMTAQSKTFKKVIANFDSGIIKKSLEDLYYKNLVDPDIDDDTKGDMKIITKGVLGMSLHEQLQLRRQEFLQMVLGSNVLMNTIGNEGLVKLLREVVKTLDMPGDMMLPSDSKLSQMEEKVQQNKAMQGTLELLKGSVENGIITIEQFQAMIQVMSSGGQEMMKPVPSVPQEPVQKPLQPGGEDV